MTEARAFGRRLKTLALAYSFVLPALIIYAVFVFVPIFTTFYYSTLKWNGIGPKVFVGLSNFARLLTDKGLHAAFYFTLVVLFASTRPNRRPVPKILRRASTATPDSHNREWQDLQRRACYRN